MPWSPEQKLQSRERILSSAARLFTQQGFDNVGIDAVMADAGMTRGAFYSHFASKSALYAESIATAARQAYCEVQGDTEEPNLNQVVERYLSEEHRRGERINCPLALLISDIGQRDDNVRDVYTRIFKGFVGLLGERSGVERDVALQQAVLIIGGMAVSRALSDDETAQELLKACQAGAIDLKNR